MKPTVEALLNDTDVAVFVVATGYPSQLQAALTGPCGTSKLVMGASFPYSVEESRAFAGACVPLGVDREGVIALAHAAYVRAVANLTEQDALHRDAVGLAVTAVVATNREHRGAHRVHVAVTSRRGTLTLSMELKKGVGDEERALDARACDALALDLLAFHVSLPVSVCRNLSSIWSLRVIETWKPMVLSDQEELDQVLLFPHYGPDGRSPLLEIENTTRCLVPATLNPLHVGHFDMADEAGETYGLPVTYLVSAVPPQGSKPSLRGCDALYRVGQVMGWNRMRRAHHEVLFVAQGGLYEDYARMFPGSVLSLGMDAFARMLERRWYPDGDPAKMMKRIASFGCKFRIHPRKLAAADVTFDITKELLAAAQNHLMPKIELGRSCHDVSSTELRAKMAQAAKGCT